MNDQPPPPPLIKGYSLSKIRLNTFAIICAFVTGSLVAGFLVHKVHTFVADRSARRNAQADLNLAVLVLNQLRAAKTNAVFELMETKLDGAVVTLSAEKIGRRDYGAQSSLQRAKEYRAKYPRTAGKSEADSFAVEALKETGTPEKK
jgi:hypothetical protein